MLYAVGTAGVLGKVNLWSKNQDGIKAWATILANRDQSSEYHIKALCRITVQRCNIGRNTYEKYEAGELNIRISVLIKLKEIYNCIYDYFFTDL